MNNVFYDIVVWAKEAVKMLTCEKCGRDPRDHAEHMLIVEFGLCNECYDKVKDKSKLVKRGWCEEHGTFDTCHPDGGIEDEET